MLTTCLVMSSAALMLSVYNYCCLVQMAGLLKDMMQVLKRLCAPTKISDTPDGPPMHMPFQHRPF